MTLMYMYVRQGPDSFVEVCYLLGQIGLNLPQGKMALPLSSLPFHLQSVLKSNTTPSITNYEFIYRLLLNIQNFLCLLQFSVSV